MKSLNVSRWKSASTSAEQKCFRIRTDNGAGFPAGTLARYYPGIEDGCVTTGVLRQGGHETHGETDPLGSEILNGNDYSKLLLLGLGVPNSHSVGLLKPVHPFVQPLIPPPESTLQIFIVSTLFQARLAPEHHPPLPPSSHPVDTLSIYIYICTYMYIYIYTTCPGCVSITTARLHALPCLLRLFRSRLARICLFVSPLFPCRHGYDARACSRGSE